ncbi:MAG TPA: GspH/FimT family pseudopilin [Steroidobacteraceae bacterium]|jgi:type IV fimbrial biogenesis protein FimT|nr:GspH/FimT family pseudopilin [Steroidobacteraceae bacterium]
MAIRLNGTGAVTRTSGFSLLELLVTIGIAGILAAIAVPAMRTYVQTYQASNAASSLVVALNYARSEAIKEDVPTAGGAGITICASTLATAPPTCDTGSWASGWIVLTPNVALGNAGVLQQSGALPATFTLTQAPANATIVFQPNGTAPALVGDINGRSSFKLCDARGAKFARELEVSRTGIIQASQTLGQDVSGAALTCP